MYVGHYGWLDIQEMPVGDRRWHVGRLHARLKEEQKQQREAEARRTSSTSGSQRGKGKTPPRYRAGRG